LHVPGPGYGENPLFNKPVVFVVGAGASHEYNLPLGGALKDAIARKVRFRFEHGSYLTGGDQELLDHIRRHVSDRDRQNVYTRAGDLLAKAIGSFISIDEALHYVGATPEAVEVGKVAIIQEILQAERDSSLSYDKNTGTLVVDSVNGGWIGEVLSMAVAGIQRAELRTAFDRVTFINFNYDRAIEQYLYWALQQRASATADDAKQIVEKLNVIKPYRSVGPLSFNFNDERSYGTSAYFDPFKRIKNMRTYTEQKPLHDAEALAKALAAANLIIFLGFGYHATNLDLLKVPPDTHNQATVLGTFVGIHHGNMDVITGRITTNLRVTRERIQLQNMTASTLLSELRQHILIALE
jgi:hypothetical protein